MTGEIRIAIIAVLLAMTPADTAAEDSRLPTIGEVFGSNPSASKPYDQAFRDGLRDLGYVDGKNVRILARYADGDSTRFPAILAELVALRVDILVVTPTAAHVAKTATSAIPIVIPSHSDPVKAGLAASLAHPGGNITGLSAALLDTEPKRLELALEVVPGLKRLGVLFEAYPELASAPDWAAQDTAFTRLARRHGVTLYPYEVKSLEDIQAAISKATRDRVQAVSLFTSYLTIQHREAIIQGLLEHRIPVIGAGKEMAGAGALLTYSPDFFDLWKRSAAYVDRILKGAKPGDLPIEQATKFDLIVNLRTAKAMGVTIPESILVRADDVIR